MSRKEGGRGLASIEDCVDVLMQEIEEGKKRAKKDYLQQPVTAIAT